MTSLSMNDLTISRIVRISSEVSKSMDATYEGSAIPVRDQGPVRGAQLTRTAEISNADRQFDGSRLWAPSVGRVEPDQISPMPDEHLHGGSSVRLTASR
jgi:hypothetical protein